MQLSNPATSPDPSLAALFAAPNFSSPTAVAGDSPFPGSFAQVLSAVQPSVAEPTAGLPSAVLGIPAPGGEWNRLFGEGGASKMATPMLPISSESKATEAGEVSGDSVELLASSSDRAVPGAAQPRLWVGSASVRPSAVGETPVEGTLEVGCEGHVAVSAQRTQAAGAEAKSRATLRGTVAGKNRPVAGEESPAEDESVPPVSLSLVAGAEVAGVSPEIFQSGVIFPQAVVSQVKDPTLLSSESSDESDSGSEQTLDPAGTLLDEPRNGPGRSLRRNPEPASLAVASPTQAAAGMVTRARDGVEEVDSPLARDRELPASVLPVSVGRRAASATTEPSARTPTYFAPLSDSGGEVGVGDGQLPTSVGEASLHAGAFGDVEVERIARESKRMESIRPEASTRPSAPAQNANEAPLFSDGMRSRVKAESSSNTQRSNAPVTVENLPMADPQQVALPRSVFGGASQGNRTEIPIENAQMTMETQRQQVVLRRSVIGEASQENLTEVPGVDAHVRRSAESLLEGTGVEMASLQVTTPAPAKVNGGKVGADGRAEFGAFPPLASAEPLEAANIAEIETNVLGASAIEVGEISKKVLGSDGKRVVKHMKGVGTDVANTDPVMPFAAVRLPLADPISETAPSLLAAAAPNRDGFSVEAPSAEALNQAHRAVDAVLVAAQRFSSGDRHSVNLEFSVAGEDLKVRVELRADEVRTTFSTSSAELRVALSQEWQVAAAPNADRGLRLSEPTFREGASTSAGTFGAETNSGQRQAPGFFQTQTEAFSLTVPRLRALRRTEEPEAVTSNRLSRRPLSTALHLHTLA